MIWKKRPTLEELQQAGHQTMVERLGIEFTEVGEDYIEARMPVDKRTMQPMGLLHGGASAAMAETLGAYLSVEGGMVCVGLEINANHVRPAGPGWVFGRATALRIFLMTWVQIIVVSILACPRNS